MTQGDPRTLACSRGERFLARAFDLSALFSGERGPPEHVAALREQRRLAAECGLEAYARLGLLDPEMAAGWRERLELGESAPGPPAPLRTAPGVRAVLQRHWGELQRLPRPDLRADPAGASHEPWRTAMRALSTFELAAAVSASDASEFRGRFFAWANGQSVEEHREHQRRRRFSGLELQRVIAGPSPRREDVCLLSVELYADGVVVNWHRRAEPVTSTRMDRRFHEYRLSDDADGEYLPVGGGGGGTAAGGFSGSVVFAGAVPQRADMLYADCAEGRFVIDLRHQTAGSSIR